MFRSLIFILACTFTVHAAVHDDKGEPHVFEDDAMSQLLTLPYLVMDSNWDKFDQNSFQKIDLRSQRIQVRGKDGEFIQYVYIKNVHPRNIRHKIAWLVESRVGLYSLVKYTPGTAVMISLLADKIGEAQQNSSLEPLTRPAGL